MRTLLVLVLGLALGAFGYWLYTQSRSGDPAPDLQRDIAEGASRLKETWTEKVGDLKTEQIKEELAQTGKVVRKKAREVGAAVADATADARITASIKTKLAVDSELSALSISVNTTEGVVTLAGTVASHDHIGKAMRLALETDGVSEVISTLQVSSRQ